jgi:RNA polymerase sigma factor (sigma-70 family)
MRKKKEEQILSLLERYRGGIRAMGARAAPMSDPEDVLQEAALAAVEAARRWRAGRGGSLAALWWPRFRKALAALGAADRPLRLPRRVRRRAAAGEEIPAAAWPLPLEALGELPAKDGDPLALLLAEEEQAERRRLLRAALARLPALERRVVCLRFGLGAAGELTPREAARYLGIRPGQVLALQRRALGRLREALKAEGGWG